MNDRPIDIAIFVPSLEGGGAERVMATLANGFASRGYRVDLVLVSATGPYLTLLNDDVHVVDLAGGSVFRSVGALVRYLRQSRPRAFLSALSHANLAAIVARRLADGNTRLVVSERLSLSAARQHHRSMKDRIIRTLMRRLYRKADRVVVVAEAMVTELESQLGLSRSVVETIYNPVVNQALLDAAARPCDHPWMDDVGSIPVILGCGRLSAQKDFPTLLEAFRIVRDRRVARLVILGEGEDRPILEAQVQKLGLDGDVDLPGFANNPFAFMAAASVFVLSSIYEGMPGTLIQAMACGTTVVSTRCPTGPEEILEEGRWGELVPMRDPRAMAAAIERALDDPNARAQSRAEAFGEAEAVTRYLHSLQLPAHARTP